MDPAEIGAWIAVAVGLIIAVSAYQATRYFGTHKRALDGTEGEWVVGAFHSTCAAITFIAIALTIARMITMRYGVFDILQLIQAVLVLGLFLIPQFLLRVFKSKEGVVMATKSERGQTLVEYGLLLALIAVIVIAALLFLGPLIADLFSNVGTRVGS